jgi:hypothetical protein
MRISLGTAPNGKTVYIELEVLLKTRLLVQANSGGGKSFLLRRLIEQIAGKVPQFVIDEEGEFPSLQEKFPFLWVGKGGDTPADVRTAAILATRLRDLRVSAVFDLSELKPQTRQHWVRLFLDALVESPRPQWKHIMIHLDEAHHYAPEGGKSEAFGSVVDVATRGRKRGLCLVAATQRLSKLTKDVTGELLNRLIGPTFEDLDLDRAADLLSIPKGERALFEKEMRVLTPGNFHALGRAFGTERLMVKVGGVQTTHPELGRSKRLSVIPPTPEKIRAILPKLADLPKEADDKAKTEAEFRKENRELRLKVTTLERQIAQAPKALPAPAASVTKVERVEVPVIPAGSLRRVEVLMTKLGGLTAHYQAALEPLRAIEKSVVGAVAKIIENQKRKPVTLPAVPVAESSGKAIPRPQPGHIVPTVIQSKTMTPGSKFVLTARGGNGHESSTDIPPAAQRILKTLLTFQGFGFQAVRRNWIAGWLSLSYAGGGFRNMLGLLRTRGLVEYPTVEEVALTPDGVSQSPPPEIYPEPGQIIEHCYRAITGAQRAILQVIFDAYPKGIPRAEVAERLNLSVMGGGFRNNLGALRTAGFIVYPDQESVRASDWIYKPGG